MIMHGISADVSLPCDALAWGLAPPSVEICADKLWMRCKVAEARGKKLPSKCLGPDGVVRVQGIHPVPQRGPWRGPLAGEGELAGESSREA